MHVSDPHANVVGVNALPAELVLTRQSSKPLQIELIQNTRPWSQALLKANMFQVGSWPWVRHQLSLIRVGWGVCSAQDHLY